MDLSGDQLERKDAESRVGDPIKGEGAVSELDVLFKLSRCDMQGPAMRVLG